MQRHKGADHHENNGFGNALNLRLGFFYQVFKVRCTAVEIGHQSGHKGGQKAIAVYSLRQYKGQQRNRQHQGKVVHGAPGAVCAQVAIKREQRGPSDQARCGAPEKLLTQMHQVVGIEQTCGQTL